MHRCAVLCCRYEFKFLLEHRSGHLEWENGTNRTFTVPKTAAEMLVEGNWGSTQVGADWGLRQMTGPHTNDAAFCHNIAC